LLAPEIFTRAARDLPRLASTHYRVGGEHVKFGLKFSMWVPITLGLVGLTSQNFTRWFATKWAW